VGGWKEWEEVEREVKRSGGSECVCVFGRRGGERPEDEEGRNTGERAIQEHRMPLTLSSVLLHLLLWLSNRSAWTGM